MDVTSVTSVLITSVQVTTESDMIVQIVFFFVVVFLNEQDPVYVTTSKNQPEVSFTKTISSFLLLFLFIVLQLLRAAVFPSVQNMMSFNDLLQKGKIHPETACFGNFSYSCRCLSVFLLMVLSSISKRNTVSF